MQRARRRARLNYTKYKKCPSKISISNKLHVSKT